MARFAWTRFVTPAESIVRRALQLLRPTAARNPPLFPLPATPSQPTPAQVAALHYQLRDKPIMANQMVSLLSRTRTCVPTLLFFTL